MLEGRLLGGKKNIRKISRDDVIGRMVARGVLPAPSSLTCSVENQNSFEVHVECSRSDGTIKCPNQHADAPNWKILKVL